MENIDELPNQFDISSILSLYTSGEKIIIINLKIKGRRITHHHNVILIFHLFDEDACALRQNGIHWSSGTAVGDAGNIYLLVLRKCGR